MKKEELFDNGTTQLCNIMSDLQGINRKLAENFYGFYGETKEIEDDFDYMEVQRSIHAAITQVGQILGTKVAEKFF